MTMLPRTEIHAFTLYDETADALRAAGADWRMQRCKLDVFEGGIDAAINHYANRVSPQLVIIEIDNTNDDTVETVAALADFCCADTKAVVIGCVNDVKLYRSLTQMGVSDYLVPPVLVDDILQSFSKALAAGVGENTHQLISVIGAKGGVGATSISQAISWQLSEEIGDQVMLLDLCGSTGTAGIALGAEGQQGLEDMISDLTRLDADALKVRSKQATEKFSVIAGGRNNTPVDRFSFEDIDFLLDVALKTAPNVVVDLPTGWTSLTRMVARRSAHRIIVSSPMLGSLRNARMILEELNSTKVDDKAAELVINNVGLYDSKTEIPVNEALRSLAIDEASAIVPHLPGIFPAAEMAGTGFRSDRVTRQALSTLSPLAYRLAGEENRSGAKELAASSGGNSAKARAKAHKKHKKQKKKWLTKGGK